MAMATDGLQTVLLNSTVVVKNCSEIEDVRVRCAISFVWMLWTFRALVAILPAVHTAVRPRSEYLGTFRPAGKQSAHTTVYASHGSDELWLRLRSCSKCEVPAVGSVIMLSGMRSLPWNVTAERHLINGSSELHVLLHTYTGCPHYLGLAANTSTSVATTGHTRIANTLAAQARDHADAAYANSPYSDETCSPASQAPPPPTRRKQYWEPFSGFWSYSAKRVRVIGGSVVGMAAVDSITDAEMWCYTHPKCSAFIFERARPRCGNIPTAGCMSG